MNVSGDYLFYALLASVMMAVSGACQSVLQNCDVLSGNIVNCLDYPGSCLTLSTNIQYMLISNNTQKLSFDDGGGIATLIIHEGTAEQLQIMCQIHEITTIISHGKIACDIPEDLPRNMISNTVFEIDSVTSPVPIINASIPKDGHVIAYFIWGGVACSVLILVLIAVIAIMLRKKSVNRTIIDDQFETKVTEF